MPFNKDPIASDASVAQMAEASKDLALQGGYTIANLAKSERQGVDYIHLVIEFGGPSKEVITREFTVSSVGFDAVALANLAQQTLDKLNSTAIGPAKLSLGVIDLSVLDKPVVVVTPPTAEQIARQAFFNDLSRLFRFKSFGLAAAQAQIDALSSDLEKRYLPEYFDSL